MGNRVPNIDLPMAQPICRSAGKLAGIGLRRLGGPSHRRVDLDAGRCNRQPTAGRLQRSGVFLTICLLALGPAFADMPTVPVTFSSSPGALSFADSHIALGVASKPYFLESGPVSKVSDKPLVDFRFEDYNNSSDDNDRKKLQEYFNQRYPRGSPLSNVVLEFERAGAKCIVLKRFPDNLWCPYNLPSPGLRGLFITREWKILVYPQKETDGVDHIEVYVGSTGL
jgi:hypothetical protein